MVRFPLKRISFVVCSLFLLNGCSSIQTQQKQIHGDMLNATMQSKQSRKMIEPEDTKAIQIADVVSIDQKAPRFNLSVRNVPVSSLLNALVEGTDYSMVLPEDITGTVTLNLKKVTAFDVFEILRKSYYYDYEVEDNQIVFHSNGVKTKVFVINHLTGNRKGQSELRVTSGSLTENVTSGSIPGTGTSLPGGSSSVPGVGQKQGTSTKVTTNFESDFWKELSTVLNLMLPDKDSQKVIVSPETNTLIVNGTAKEIQKVESYLKKIQAIVEKQVIIEAKLIEVQLSSGVQSGINWSAFRTGPNSRVSGGFTQSGATLQNGSVPNAAGQNEISLTGNNVINSIPGSSLVTGALGTAGSVFGLAFQTNNFASILNFLETQGSLQVLSSPRIATLNNQKAILKVGVDEFFVTNISTTTNTSTTGTGTTTPSVTTQPFFSGIALDITPQIDDKGFVTMHVHPTVSDVSTVMKKIDLGATMGVLSLPLASSSLSETDSIVRVENNRIVAIGGLMKQYSKSDKSKIPGLGDAPLVGAAFKNSDENTSKYELVILIKPTVVSTSSDWDRNLEEVRNRLRSFSPSLKNSIFQEKIEKESKKKGK